MNAVWQKSKAKGSDRLLLIALADCSDDDGVSWPNQRWMARKTLLTDRACRTIVDRLAASGELVIERNINHIKPSLADRVPRYFFRIVCVKNKPEETSGSRSNKPEETSGSRSNKPEETSGSRSNKPEETSGSRSNKPEETSGSMDKRTGSLRPKNRKFSSASLLCRSDPLGSDDVQSAAAAASTPQPVENSETPQPVENSSNSPLLDLYGSVWAARYGRPNAPPNHQQQLAAAKLCADHRWDELTMALGAFIASDEPGVITCQHAFPLFAKQALRWIVTATKAGQKKARANAMGLGRNCPHSIRCETFSACRDRILADARSERALATITTSGAIA